MIESKTINSGPVGTVPKGPYSGTADYRFLHTVFYDHDSWVCVYLGSDGTPFKSDGTWLTVKGQAPSDSSPYWKRLTDGGKLAFEQAANAQEMAGLAQQKAEYADTQGTYAKNQGDYAKNQGDYVKSKVDEASRVEAVLEGSMLSVTSRNGSTVSTDLKGPKGDPGKDIDYSSLTTGEKQELVDYIAQRIAEEGGYAMHPVEEGSLAPSSTFVKYSVICIDGIVYISNKETDTLPFPMVVNEGMFVTQTFYGHTCFLKAGNTLSADWNVWIDARNDIRFMMLEERVARLETLIR